MSDTSMIRVTISLTPERLELLDKDAKENGRTRSSAIGLLIDRHISPWTITTTIPDPQAGKPPCPDGQHVRAEAKSGSGLIGCKNCGWFKGADGTWRPRA